MTVYETGFLISPQLTEEDAEAVIQQMADIVAQRQGKMIRIEKWGKRRTAYDIKKFGDAYYVFLHYEGGTDIPLELNRRFRQMDTVLRHLTLVKETRQNVRKKKKVQKKTPGRETAEEAAAAAVAETQAQALALAQAEQRKREET
ncbi:MAG: 30S ribosomal protein S6 [Candidatus Aminicenantales bacterium]|jgi:small subunit ribosomal protein S6